MGPTSREHGMLSTGNAGSIQLRNLHQMAGSSISGSNLLRNFVPNCENLIDIRKSLSSRVIKSFEDFVGHQPPLTMLQPTLGLEHPLTKTVTVENIIKELQRLRLLIIDY